MAVNLLELDAAGDGVTDDSAALNAAIASNQAVYMPDTENGYLLSSAISVQKEGSIFGDQHGTKIILPNGASNNLFEIAASNVTIKNLRLAGNGTQTGNLFHLQTSVCSPRFIRIQDINAAQCGRFINDDATGINTVTNLWVEKCWHRQPSNGFVVGRDLAAFIFFNDCVADFVGTNTNSPAFKLSYNSGVIFDNCEVEGGTISGMSQRNGFEISNCQAVWLRRCMGDTLGGSAFKFISSNYLHLEQCTGSLCDLHQFDFDHCWQVDAMQLYAGGRRAVGGTSGQHGIYLHNNTQAFNCNGAFMVDNTGTGLYSDCISSVMVGASFGLNAHGNYSLGNSNQHLRDSQLYSGAMADLCGPAAG